MTIASMPMPEVMNPMASNLTTETTWPSLVRVEPNLRALEQTALNAYRFHFREERDWETIKSQLNRLVGWNAKTQELATPQAYDVAYRHLRKCWGEGRRA